MRRGIKKHRLRSATTTASIAKTAPAVFAGQQSSRDVPLGVKGVAE